MIKIPLALEYIGETKYLRVLKNHYNNEKPELWILDRTESIPKASAASVPQLPIYWDCPKEFVEQTGVKMEYVWYEREENWRERLIKSLSKYKTIEKVDLDKVLSSVYKPVWQKTLKRGEMRLAVNGDTSHLLDMNEIIMRIIKPIEDIRGDVYFFYNYQDRYLVLREFMHNKIYIFDTHNEQTRRKFCELLSQEKIACSLHFRYIQVGSQIHSVYIESDQPRIDILLNPNSSKEERKKAKG